MNFTTPANAEADDARRLRVLLFNTDLEIGGTPGVVRELARRLPDGMMEVEVACLGRFGPVAEGIRADGGRVTAFNAGALQLHAAVGRLRQLISERRIDVVLSFLVHANVVAALASRKCRGVLWLQSIQTTQPRPRWHWPVQRLAARSADGFVVPSESVCDVAHVRCGIDPSRVTVIPNAVDAAGLAAGPRTISSPMRVGFLGRLDPIKNVDVLIASVMELGDCALHIYGDGPDRMRLERAAAGSGRVHFHGFTDRDVALESIDVLVLPSSAEGFGNALIEAMAAGIPVIGTDVPGIRNVIDAGQTGLLVPDGDAGALTLALRRLRDDQELAGRLATAALAKVRAGWTWDRVIPKYRTLLAHGTRRAARINDQPVQQTG